MYDAPRQRGGLWTGTRRARQVPVEAHEGSYRDYLRRHARQAAQAALENLKERQGFVAQLLDRAADTRNLRCAWDYLASSGGQAPGWDGLCYDDLDDNQVWRLVNDLKEALLAGTYHLGKVSRLAIPKASGRGTRTLVLTSIIDRLVERALLQIIQPLLDPGLDDHCYGFRPGRDRRHALARAERLAHEDQRFVWIGEDIRDAFDQLPQSRLLQVIRKHLPDDRLMALIERLLVTQTKRGIRQGSPLSGLWLNLYLDHVIDRQWRQSHPTIPLLRVADDLLLLCHTQGEAHQAYTNLRQYLIAAGMPLKGNPSTTIHNLAEGAHIDWLGYRLQLGRDSLQVHIGERSWRQLDHRLAEAQYEPNSCLLARQVIEGWLSQLGPMYHVSDHAGTIARVDGYARMHGYEELPSQAALLHRWRTAHEAYLRIRTAERNRTTPAEQLSRLRP